MRAPALASLTPLIIAVCACSATADDKGFDGAGAFGSSGSGTGAGGEDIITGSGGGGPVGNGCSEGADLVYVLSDDNRLFRFRPLDRAFEEIGPLACPTSMQPNSMAVDRTATAWVNYVQSDSFGSDTAGALFKVSTIDASCQGPIMNLPDGYYRLGMGFSTDAVGAEEETLFVTGTDPSGFSPGLARIDTKSLTLTTVGPFTGSLAGQNAELTGTGDARLYGFFTTTPVYVAEIDKASSNILSKAAMTNLPTPAAWAFSFWGGDFYLYTADFVASSDVTHYRPSDGTVDLSYMVDIGFRIVGAGVSTCAPVAPPK